MKITLSMRFQAVAARCALWLLRRMTPAQASNLGALVCRLIGPQLPVSRVADDNLRMAMPELDPVARKRIVVGVWENIGRTVCEFTHIAALRKDTPSGPGWELVGEEHLLHVAASGGQVIFVSGHIGNWEILPAVTARYGLPLASVYRAADNPLLNTIIHELRTQSTGIDMPLFPKGAKGARGVLSHLSKGGHLGLLVDQKMNDGVEARFFGKPAMTAPALAAMALRYKATVIPGHVERIGPARFRLFCEPPLSLPDTGDRQGDQLLLTQTVNDLLERWIREKPESWLWLHRRWSKHVVHEAIGAPTSSA